MVSRKIYTHLIEIADQHGLIGDKVHNPVAQVPKDSNTGSNVVLTARSVDFSSMKVEQLQTHVEVLVSEIMRSDTPPFDGVMIDNGTEQSTCIFRYCAHIGQFPYISPSQ